MYRYLDHRTADLAPAEAFIVAATRKWVGAVSKRKCPADAVASDFLDRGLMAGIGAFHRILTVLNVRARLRFGFAMEGCPLIAEGEALILSLLQERCSRAVTLQCIFGQEHVAEVCSAAIDDFNAALHVAGMPL